MISRRAIVPRGFTLLEILIALAILAVLVTAGFMAGIRTNSNHGKAGAARISISALESAVNAFHADYGILPIPGPAGGDEVVRSDHPAFLEMLLGTEKGPVVLNTRHIRYLACHEGKIDGEKGKNGLVVEPDGKVRGLYDPWGGVFFIRLDGDHDGKIDEVKTDAAATATTLSGKICAIWTNGPDGEERGSGKTADDVTSWQP